MKQNGCVNIFTCIMLIYKLLIYLAISLKYFLIHYFWNHKADQQQPSLLDNI